MIYLPCHLPAWTLVVYTFRYALEGISRGNTGRWSAREFCFEGVGTVLHRNAKHAVVVVVVTFIHFTCSSSTDTFVHFIYRSTIASGGRVEGRGNN